MLANQPAGQFTPLYQFDDERLTAPRHLGGWRVTGSPLILWSALPSLDRPGAIHE
jgi:hypothetical protein